MVLSAALLHRARTVIVVTWNSLSLLHFLEDHLRRCKCVFPQSWLIIQTHGDTGCDEYAHAHLIVVLREHIAYLGKIVKIPVKRIIQSLPLLVPSLFVCFWFNLLDGFIPDLGRHMETVAYKLLKTRARVLPEKSHSSSGKQCISLRGTGSAWCPGAGYTNRDLQA